MRRRAFLSGSAAVLAAPLAVDAQQAGKMYGSDSSLPGSPRKPGS
jgi:hypothetical protein